MCSMRAWPRRRQRPATLAAKALRSKPNRVACAWAKGLSARRVEVDVADCRAGVLPYGSFTVDRVGCGYDVMRRRTRPTRPKRPHGAGVPGKRRAHRLHTVVRVQRGAVEPVLPEPIAVLDLRIGSAQAGAFRVIGLDVLVAVHRERAPRSGGITRPVPEDIAGARRRTECDGCSSGYRCRADGWAVDAACPGYRSAAGR